MDYLVGLSVSFIGSSLKYSRDGDGPLHRNLFGEFKRTESKEVDMILPFTRHPRRREVPKHFLVEGWSITNPHILDPT